MGYKNPCSFLSLLVFCLLWFSLFTVNDLFITNIHFLSWMSTFPFSISNFTFPMSTFSSFFLCDVVISNLSGVFINPLKEFAVDSNILVRHTSVWWVHRLSSFAPWQLLPYLWSWLYLCLYLLFLYQPSVSSFPEKNNSLTFDFVRLSYNFFIEL